MIEDIIQNMISRLGQSQDDRTPKELGAHFVDIDERTPADLLMFSKRFSKFVNYYSDTTAATAGNWEPFFPYDEEGANRLIDADDGTVTPHLALMAALFKLYETSRETANTVPGRHLEFYYRRVLGFEPKPPVPDRAHLVLALKSNAAPILINGNNAFSAGKDDTGVELIYVPTGNTVINTAAVSSLRSIFLDDAGHGTVRFAPNAKSADGVSAPLTELEPKWRAFGYPQLPAARIGWAIASPVLRMKEGARKVTVSLNLSNLPTTVNSSVLEGLFDVFLTGEKKWLGPYGISPQVSGNMLTFSFDVAPNEPAVINYDAALHGYSYFAQSPVMQIILKTGGTGVGYNDLRELILQKASVSVDVSGVTSLTLRSDAGALDAKKAFLPFGPQPVAGSRFVIGSTEALSKKLSELSLTVQWKGAPASFATQYANYGVTVNDSTFTASVSFEDGGSWVEKDSGVKLFVPRTGDSVTFKFTPGGASTSSAASDATRVYALNAAGTSWARSFALRRIQLNPALRPFIVSPPKPRDGFITFALERNFLHETYRVKYVEHVMKYSKGEEKTLVVLNEPYTPAIQSISLAYKAHTDEVAISSPNLDEFANPDLQFFHIGPFGEMRDHRYQREQFDFVTTKNVPLLPRYEHSGEFLIGLSRLQARDSVSLLFQVAEGSANPELEQAHIEWSALCDNFWKRLGTAEVVLDTTNQLLRSGIVQFVLPAEVTTDNTILPAGFTWLRAAISGDVTAVSQLIDVFANGLEVAFRDNSNDANHLTTALPAKRIVKLNPGVASVKSVSQPYASFGGRPREAEGALNTRASERLRHKNRCVTPWDYERIVLQQFPSVHKVKCIPHAKDGNWLAPGHVMLVVIPDLRNQNAMDPLQPRVDANTLSEIAAHLQSRIGMQVQVHVKNPRYQKLQLNFKVKFRTGFEFNFYSGVLRQDLVRMLSPWAFEPNRQIEFGGHVYKSVLLDAVEDLGYVDYVTDFKMSSYNGSVNNNVDVNEARPETPDAILVSDQSHSIAEAD